MGRDHGRYQIVNDTDTDSRFYADISKSIGYPTYSILAAPMRVRDVTVGVIEILNKKQKKYFTQDDLRWLELFSVQAALAIENARFLEKAQEEIHYLRDKVQAERGWHNLIAKSPLILEKLDLIERVAKTDSSVLILGESGVGKELFAEQVHPEVGEGGQTLHPRQLRGAARGAARERAFRPCQGRLYRRRAEPAGSL